MQSRQLKLFGATTACLAMMLISSLLLMVKPHLRRNPVERPCSCCISSCIWCLSTGGLVIRIASFQIVLNTEEEKPSRASAGGSAKLEVSTSSPISSKAHSSAKCSGSALDHTAVRCTTRFRHSASTAASLVTCCAICKHEISMI